MEQSYIADIKPITIDIFAETMSKRIDDMEPRLIRPGYNEKVIAEQFRYRPADIRKLLSGDIDAAKAKEMTAEMREAGLPI